MKTTLDIEESVMRRLREEAARRGTTTSALVEARLRRVLAEPEESQGGGQDTLPPLPTWKSGGLLVDISNRDELYRVLDGEGVQVFDSIAEFS